MKKKTSQVKAWAVLHRGGRIVECRCHSGSRPVLLIMQGGFKAEAEASLTNFRTAVPVTISFTLPTPKKK